jgi:ATP-dependent 26S proteasome regulatory subunit
MVKIHPEFFTQSSLFKSVFSFTRMTGIRAGSGNVMLYGPAGTGKTIMCQAAAFEARAELIIGESDGSQVLYSYVWQL